LTLIFGVLVDPDTSWENVDGQGHRSKHKVTGRENVFQPKVKVKLGKRLPRKVDWMNLRWLKNRPEFVL